MKTPSDLIDPLVLRAAINHETPAASHRPFVQGSKRSPMRMSLALTALGFAFVLLSTGLVSAQNDDRGATQASAERSGQPTVATVQVERALVAAASRWIGTVEAVRSTRIAAQSTGRVVTLLAQAGDSVEAGQMLAEVDAQEVTLGTTRAEAALAQAQASARQARLTLTRDQQLRLDGFISQAALDFSSTGVATAEAAEREAVAALDSARVSTGYYRLTAPYDAVVARREVEIGDLILPGRGLFEL